MECPLILTLRMDDEAFSYLDGLRRAHFPPERNFLAAHLTLFHHLPAAERPAVDHTLSALAGATAPLALQVTGLRMLGNGVAFRIESERLMMLRKKLRDAFAPWLTPQDRAGFVPHVTVQNKVAAPIARALHEQLSPGFRPFGGISPGLDLWHYRGGPWDHAYYFPFVPAEGADGSS